MPRSTRPHDPPATTKPWSDLTPSAQATFTTWLADDPTGQTVAADANGDMDYALWLVAVDLNCHIICNKPYTTTWPDTNWRHLYDAGQAPVRAIEAAALAAQQERQRQRRAVARKK